MKHVCEYQYQYCPQTNIASGNKPNQICAVPLKSQLRFRQVWALTWGLYTLRDSWFLQFWKGALFNWNTANTSFAPVGELVLELPLAYQTSNASYQIAWDGRETTSNNPYPAGFYIEFGTSANGNRCTTKNFDLNIEADFATIITIPTNSAGARVVEGFLGIISSDFPARPYHEQNFQPLI